MITQQRIRELFSYSPETGLLTRNITLSNNAKAGSVVSCRNAAGYIVTSIDGRLYYAHRIIWMHVHGEWPSCGIDHANMLRSDNRLLNLRLATQSQNMGNIRGWASSGHKSVYLNKSSGRWYARIQHNGKTIHIGTFSKKEDAISAVRIVTKSVRGAFARTS